MSSGHAAVLSLRPSPTKAIDRIQGSQLFALLGVGLTAIRVPVGLLGLSFLVRGEALAACLAFVGFAALDIADGAASRRGAVDNALRRSVDVLTDRVFIHLAAAICVLSTGRGYALVGLFMGRDLVQAAFSVYLFRRYRVVIIGAKWHMWYGISMLAWGCWFIMDGTISAPITAIALPISLATLADYIIRSLKISQNRSRGD